MIINNNYAFSHKLKYTTKRNGFVGCFVPEISGVENHPVKKNDQGECFPEKIIRAFYALKSYFIRKVSRSITIAMIAMPSIAFSYFVTEGFLHSREIGGKLPHLSSFFCNSLAGKRIRYKDNPGTSWPQRCEYNNDLYPCPKSRSRWCNKSSG